MSAVPSLQYRFQPMMETSLSEVVAIEDAIYEFPWTLGNFRDSLKAGYSCWEYRADRDLIGYAIVMFGVDEAHLLNLSIAPNAQGKGFGGRFLVHLIQVTRSHAADRMILEVRPSNVAGRALYASFGFESIGTRRGYYPARGGREDAVVLSLPL